MSRPTPADPRSPTRAVAQRTLVMLRGCFTGPIIAIASLCPLPGTLWDCSTPSASRICVASPTATMRRDCTCTIVPTSTGPQLLGSTCTLTMTDAATGETVHPQFNAWHRCATAPTPRPRIARTCDPNHNGVVSIGEVQQAVNGFLGECK